MKPLIKSYVGAADITAYRIVKPAAPSTGTTVTTAAAATDKSLGVATSMGGKSGEAIDVILAGPGEVRLGGTVNFNDPLTSDANGKAVVATATAGSVIAIVGYAGGPGVLDDIIPLRVAPGFLAIGAS